MIFYVRRCDGGEVSGATGASTVYWTKSGLPALFEQAWVDGAGSIDEYERPAPGMVGATRDGVLYAIDAAGEAVMLPLRCVPAQLGFQLAPDQEPDLVWSTEVYGREISVRVSSVADSFGQFRATFSIDGIVRHECFWPPPPPRERGACVSTLLLMAGCAYTWRSSSRCSRARAIHDLEAGVK